MRSVDERQLQRLGEVVGHQRVLGRSVHELDVLLLQQRAVGGFGQALAGVDGKHHVVIAQVRQEQRALAGAGLHGVAHAADAGMARQRFQVWHFEAPGPVPVGRKVGELVEQVCNRRHEHISVTKE